MPQPRVLTGSFWEDGPVTLYALWQRDDDKTDLQPDNVDTYDIRIYDLDQQESDTPVWVTAGVSQAASPIFLARQPGVGAAPSGYNFKRQIKFQETDDNADPWTSIGGHKYRFVVIAYSALFDVNGARVIWELDCKQVIAP